MYVDVMAGHPLSMPTSITLAPVDLTVELVETEWLHVWLDSFRAWPEGMTFFLRLRKQRLDGDHPTLEIRGKDDALVWPEFSLRVSFADGRTDADRPSDLSMSPGIDDAWLRSLGMDGSPDRRDCEEVLSPLPPLGPLTWTFNWPDAGIDGFARSIDSAPLIEAATSAL